jgi:hypothetical protein
MMKDQEKIPPKNPFRVPESYFEEVNRKILAATSEKPAEKKATVFRLLRPYLAVAASLAVLVVVGWLSLKVINTEKNNDVLSAIHENPEMLLNEIDLMTLETTAAETGMFDEPVQNEEIIEMLMIEDIDLNDIYEKL